LTTSSGFDKFFCFIWPFPWSGYFAQLLFGPGFDTLPAFATMEEERQIDQLTGRNSQSMKTHKKNETFSLKLAPDLERNLPIITLSGTDRRIASFVMLGDVELNNKCSRIICEKMLSEQLVDRFDTLVAIEAKGIAITHESARHLGYAHYIVIRKTEKKYMVDPLTVPVESITSFGEQTLVLDGRDAERLRGRKICIVEDVIATGGSIRAACRLIEKAGGEVTVIATVLVKGDFEDPRLVYLMRPPM
jgi:adenine phosphoribosyltransferase